MIPWPVLRREFKASARRRDAFAGRVLMAVILGGVVALMGAAAVRGDVLGRSVFPARALRDFGLATLAGVAGVEIMVLAFLVPSLVGGAIAEERERDTLPFLLLTRLTRLQIVLAKLAGRLAPALALVLVGVPYLAFASYVTGLFPELAALAVGGLASTALTMGMLSLGASSRFLQAGNARAVATLTVWAWLLVLPALRFVPTPTDPIAALLAEAARGVGRRVGASSPLSLLMDRGWASTTDLSAFAGRIGGMALTQAGLCLAALAAAVLGLKRHEPRRPPIVITATRLRPPCGDDPIYWREHTLQRPAAGAFRPLPLLRHLAALTRILLLVALQVVLQLLILAVPAALAIVVVRRAVPAFHEAWFGGNGTEERDALTLLIRLITAGLSMLSLVSVTGAAAGRITTEREKGTWVPLLTTPLDGPEILGGKLRACRSSFRTLALAPIALWLVGVACGATHPLGALLGALDLVAAIALGLALGLWLGVRPGAPSTAQSLAALASLGLTAIHVPYLAAALIPPRGFDPFLPPVDERRAILGGAFVLLPFLTAWLARLTTRRAFDRFDRYVGRPRRDPPHPRAPVGSAIADLPGATLHLYKQKFTDGPK